MKDLFFTITFLFLPFFFFLQRCLLLLVLFRSHSTLQIYLLGSLMLPTLPHCCPFYLASSFAFVFYVFLVWLTSPLHCTCFLCIQNELVGVVLLSAQCVQQAAGLNQLLSLSALSKFKGAFSCLALQELPELTSLIYPKFFLLLFSLFLAVHRNR